VAARYQRGWRGLLSLREPAALKSDGPATRDYYLARQLAHIERITVDTDGTRLSLAAKRAIDERRRGARFNGELRLTARGRG
jgi:hypothetical protein